MKTSHRLLLLVIPLLALALVSLFWRGSTQRVHAPAPVPPGTPLAGDSGASGSQRSLGARVQAAPGKLILAPHEREEAALVGDQFGFDDESALQGRFGKDHMRCESETLEVVR